MAARNTVKVDRVRLIAELEKALVKSKKDFTDEQSQREADYKKYVTDKAAFDKALLAHIKKHIVEADGDRYRSSNNVKSFNVVVDTPFDLDTRPREVYAPHKDARNTDAENIEQALKVLKLSSEDTVGASFYDSVLRYI